MSENNISTAVIVGDKTRRLSSEINSKSRKLGQKKTDQKLLILKNFRYFEEN
tara:strand:- start:782 stop:937 length:156 start_codon:yes stop_codon:yes gene_type:complete